MICTKHFGKRAAVGFAALLAALALVAVLSPAGLAGAQSAALTFTPVADAYVHQSKSNANYGTRSTLSVDGSPAIRSYLRFDVRGLNGASVSAARLRLYVTDDSANGFSVAPVSSTSWSETGITYSNAPATGAEITSIGAYGANRWIELDVTAAVKGEGLVSLALVTRHDTTTAFASREAGGNAPQLVLSLQSAPTATRTPPPATATATRTQPPPTATATRTPAPIIAPSSTSTSVFLPTVTSQPTATSAPKTLPVGQTGSWNLIFSDEFNGTTLDTSKWHTCFWWATDTCTIETNGELQLYNRDDVLVQNGMLRLRAQKRNMVGWNGKTYNYTSGLVITGGRKYEKPAGFTFLYGFAEARVKVPAGKGLWPAFWMLPSNYTSRPEIDIMEILGHEPNVQHMNYHYIGGDSGRTWTGPDFSAGWHTFAVDWSPSAIIWYIDGIERWRYTSAANIANTPQYLLLNLAVGGNWPGAPDANTVFPTYYDVDYVRVWQRP